MSSYHWFFMVALAVVSHAADAAETYRNPIIDENLADPAVIRHDGTYYLYATGEVDGDNGYRVYTSADLLNWKRGPVVFRPGQRHVWAPDVWRDPASGRFYLYYTASMTVSVAEGEGPLGPFTVRKKLFDNAIDAHLFRDDDGRLYLYFVQLPGFRITVQPMARSTEPTGEPRVVLQPESAWETRNGHVTEGPWMIKHDGRYYLLYSGSGADTPDYAVGYATSTSPLGPFTRAEHNPILHRADGLFGPGHGCAIRDGGGRWWFVYHQKRTDRREWDRFICLDPLRFDEQGRLQGRATRGELLPGPALPKEDTPTGSRQVIGFGPDRVHLIEASPFKERQELHRTVYLRNLDPDRLLAPFFHNAKLSLPAKRYPGWDSGFIEGHMGGHYLSAASRMYAATGDPSYKANVDHFVAGLKKCQQALDLREAHPGYLSAFPVAKLEQLEAIGHGGSVPYYTLHKILAGLIDAYAFCNNAQALDMAVDLSDYIAWRMSKLSEQQVAKMLETNFQENPGNEHGGIAEALVDLSAYSQARGDANSGRHIKLASIFLRDWFIDPLVAGEDRLSGLHGNSHAAIASSLARYAAVTGDQRAGKAARQFWEHVVGHHSFANGGNSFDEKLRDRGVEVSGRGNSALAAGTAEYCNTHNMLKLTRNLFELSPRAEYADYYERALSNHILATIEPRTGQVCYLTSLRPGDFRSYLPVDGTFCCNGTGLENPARFGDGIYFHRDDTLWVNLYIPSVLDWREKGIKLRQEAESPFDETIRFTVETKQPVTVKLRLRIPNWATGKNTLSLDGKLQPDGVPAGSYAEIARTWQNGDSFELKLPMQPWSRPSMDDPQMWSFFYGPVLLAAALGRDAMPPSDTGDKWLGLRIDGKAAGQHTAAYDQVPVLLADDPGNFAACLKAVPEKPHQFQAPGRVAGKSTNVTLCPLHTVHHQRFAVYLKVIPAQ
jgi:hypothetical protein